jgi:hypothetical protein
MSNDFTGLQNALHVTHRGLRTKAFRDMAGFARHHQAIALAVKSLRLTCRLRSKRRGHSSKATAARMCNVMEKTAMPPAVSSVPRRSRCHHHSGRSARRYFARLRAQWRPIRLQLCCPPPCLRRVRASAVLPLVPHDVFNSWLSDSWTRASFAPLLASEPSGMARWVGASIWPTRVTRRTAGTTPTWGAYGLTSSTSGSGNQSAGTQASLATARPEHSRRRITRRSGTWWRTAAVDSGVRVVRP